jgi:hypothetical protein
MSDDIPLPTNQEQKRTHIRNPPIAIAKPQVLSEKSKEVSVYMAQRRERTKVEHHLSLLV